MRSAALLACAAGALVLGGVAGAAGARAPSFAAPRLLAASLDPDAIAIGDLNPTAGPTSRPPTPRWTASRCW